MGLSIFTGDRKENIIKTLFRSRLARVGLIGCSIYVYRSYDFGGTLGQNVATAVLVSAMALNMLFIPSRMLRCRHGKRFFVSALPKNRFRGCHLEKKIEHMDGWEFEEYCASILRKNGFSHVEVTRGSGDFGIDVIAEKAGVRYGIQCKKYSGTVGWHAVEEAKAGAEYWECQRAVVLTNSNFSRQALEGAAKIGVELWDGQKLSSILNDKRLF